MVTISVLFYMVIKGKTRGNGKQLGEYLIDKGSRVNDFVTVLDVRGTSTRRPKEALIEMSLMGELTKGEKTLYHAQINPAIGEDRGMNYNSWVLAADALEKELKLTDQSRVIVLHEKKGRIHAHVVWQREKDGKLISDSHSFKAHDRARAFVEKTLNHNRTKQKFDEKQILTHAWNNSLDGKDFLRRLDELSYGVGKSEGRRPYKLVDSNGVESDLTRQLNGIRLSQVENRFQQIEHLPTVDEVRSLQRQKQEELKILVKEKEGSRVDLEAARQSDLERQRKREEVFRILNSKAGKDQGYSR